MPEIHLLSQSTIDQIAAGEVVERPSSVVKELVENAIDAGATVITVELRDGGISLIRVTDNGCGIEKEQIKRAFLRHATSKIASIDDLQYVESLGFRGEALSSIAAVSQVEVMTCTEGALTGLRYAIAGGVEEDIEEIGAPKGTTFLVHNLFYNTPARRKFLKQPKTEGTYVADLMEHIALSRPDISFKFVNGGQVRFHTSGNGDLKEVIYRIYGKELSDAAISFSDENELYRVKGYIGKPEVNRGSRSYELFFVNGRFVQDDTLSKALEEGYRQYVMQHKFPFAVLHMEITPQEIDVNVHPSKMQIRIHKAPDVYRLLSSSIHERLHELEMIPSVRLTEEEEKMDVPQSVAEPFEANRMHQAVMEENQEYGSGLCSMESAALAARSALNTHLNDTFSVDFYDEDGAEIDYNAAESNDEANTTADDHAGQNHFQSRLTDTVFGSTQHEYGTPVVNEAPHTGILKAEDIVFVEKPQQLNLFEEKILTSEARNEYEIIGQIFDTYWLITYKDKLLMIDQHAAHEKVRYERLVRQLQEKQVVSQQLMPPVVVDLNAKEEQVMKEFASCFQKLGFELEEFGPGGVALRSVPTDLYGCGEKELLLNMLDELMEEPPKGEPDVILQKLASMACKSAVKGNTRLSRQEMEALLDELLTLDNPYHCPHGRPTIITMSKYEIEKKFKRIVT